MPNPKEQIDEETLLHIQDHDDLIRHISDLVAMGNKHGMGDHPEWVELCALDMGQENALRVIPMLNNALIAAKKERDEWRDAAQKAEEKARDTRGQQYEIAVRDNHIAALRSLVRRMREALKGNSLWPSEVDALCAEADKAIGAQQ